MKPFFTPSALDHTHFVFRHAAGAKDRDVYRTLDLSRLYTICPETATSFGWTSRQLDDTSPVFLVIVPYYGRISRGRSVDCPLKAWIHALSSAIHGLSGSML